MAQNQNLLKLLNRPEGIIDVILDTDTYNEVDDQFALSYLLRSEDKCRTVALVAAPFSNHKSTGPADGMEKSYQEILNILDLNDRADLKAVTYRGSAAYLADEKTPVESEGARKIAEIAMTYTPENPLYVVAIGAITNVASAILMEPAIIDRIVVVFLGGHAEDWPDSNEFNLQQDVAAGRVVFNSGCALVELPCFGVVDEFRVSGPELEAYIRGKNKLCDYLTDIVQRDGAAESPYKCWSRVIWDVTAIAWLLNEGYTEDRLKPTPIPEYDHHMAVDPTRPLMRYVYKINRDALLEDLVKKLSK